MKKLKKDIKKSASVNDDNNAKPVNNLSLLTNPIVRIDQPVSISDISQGITIDDIRKAQQAAYDAKKAKYDYALTTDNAQLATEGIFVMPEGSIFQGSMESGKVWLPIQDIQQIENERGTPGALLLKLGKPAIAKDTAGYSGGSSSTWSGKEPGITPINDIVVMPPVTKDNTGETVFTADPGPVVTDNTIPAVTTIKQAAAMKSGNAWFLWVAMAAIAIFLILKYRK